MSRKEVNPFLRQKQQQSVRSNVSRRHPSICTPGSELHRLCRNGDLSAIRSYLNETAADLVINKVAGLNGCTPLHEAAMAGQGDVVRLLYEECETLDLNVRTQRGPALTPLHLASERGHVECVMALIECGASLKAVDRRCRTVKDVAIENGQRQVAHVISLSEVEKLVGEGDLTRVKEILGHIQNHGKLLDLVQEWHQKRLNVSLRKSCMLGNYKMAILIIRAGANNFKQCIEECGRQNRMNHILAFLRLCQAAYEDDKTAVDILLEWDEERISEHPRFASLIDFNQILLPLLDNGTLTITEPLHVALKANHLTTAGKILLCSSKHRNTGMVDWHGLELSKLESSWLKAQNHSNLQLLCLSFNQLTEIPTQMANFTSLVKLQVAFNKLTHVPPVLFQMPCLENLDLSYNCISALPESLSGNKVSASLQVLTLSNNLLSQFPSYFGDSSVKLLDLSKNQFKEVPESVCIMKQLESLNMSYNTEIQFIPYELGGLKHIKMLSFEGVPHSFNIRNDSLISFVKKRFKTMQTVSHYEVVTIGFPSHAQMLDAVYGQLCNKERSNLDCGFLKFDSPTHFLNLYHVFQLPSTIYFLLWDCQNGQDPNDLHRVLRHLSIYAPTLPVIVVAYWSFFNYQLEMEVEESISSSLWSDLRESIRLQHLVIVEEEGENSVTEEVEGAPAYSYSSLFLTIAELSEKVRITQFVPSSYFNCGKTLIQKQDVFYEATKCAMLSEEDFWKELSSMPSHDMSGLEELPKLLSYLMAIGIVLQVQGPSGSQCYYVFNRQWFCKVLGNVLSQQGAQVIQNVSSIVHHEGLIDLLSCPTLKLPLPGTFRHMLNKEAVALALSSEKWLIPSMLAELPDRATHIQPEQYGLRRQYTFNLTPANFWPRLITHLLINMEKFVREVSDANPFTPPSSASSRQIRFGTLSRDGVIDWSYWKHGILCWQNARHLVYSVEAITTLASSSVDTPYQEAIEIRVPNTRTGHRAMQKLSLIINTLLRNWYPKVWDSVRIWVPCGYCIHNQIPDVPSISFHDSLLALAKGVGVKCAQHPEKIVQITKVVPDLAQEDISRDMFLAPGSVRFNMEDKSTCISSPPSETVFKGTFNSTLVAVKSYPHRQRSGDGGNVVVGSDEDPNVKDKTTPPPPPPLMQMWSEFELFCHLKKAKCPFIIDIIGACVNPLCLVFPFARWSSLEDVFRAKDIDIPHFVRMRMVNQLASALCVLQTHKIIHRNICLANLLVFSLSVNDEVNIKLAGFSNACYSIFTGLSVGQHGTFPAPEMLVTHEDEYDERVDIFALAFVMYEIITETRLQVTTSAPLQSYSKLIRPSLEPIRQRAPYLVPLISKCWQPDRNKRPFACKVLQILRHPLHVLVRDGHLVDNQHEFFAAAARFTRVQNDFHSDLFVSSGQLMGKRTSYLAREPLPGLKFESSKQLPSEFVICMGCIGSQLWVSFYGKKVRVYSALNLDYINEFTFNYHVVAMAISPTSVYLGLENGVLQVYDVVESVPTEPSLTKIVHPGEEFKCLEALEDTLICANKNEIYCLQPDTLDVEGKWTLEPKREIRSIVISRCYQSQDEDEIEGNDLMWVAFRRWEQLLVMNPWTGQHYYTIDCSKITNRPASKVYVQSLRVVLDTIWVGLNTGHIFIFASNHKEPRLLTHLKVHREGVRQLLLLHPSYMGPTTVLSSSEITRSLRDPQSSLIADQNKPNFPDSVLVVSFGTGLEHSLCSMDKHGHITKETEEDIRANADGLFAVILEGVNIQHTMQVEKNSVRPSLPYMDQDRSVNGDQENIYDVPLELYNQPADDTTAGSRHDTWSANTVQSPVTSNWQHRNFVPAVNSREEVCSLTTSDSKTIEIKPANVFHRPKEFPVRVSELAINENDDKKASLHSIFTSLKRRSYVEPGGEEQQQQQQQQQQGQSSTADVTSAGEKEGSFSSKTGETFPSEKKQESDDDDDDDDDDSDYDDADADAYGYTYLDPLLRAQSYTLPPKSPASAAMLPPRRQTYDDWSRPDLEDSAEGFDPYVRMDTLFGVQGAGLRVTANRANRKARAKRLSKQEQQVPPQQQEQARSSLSEVPEEHYESREEFMGSKFSPIIPARRKPKLFPKPVGIRDSPSQVSPTVNGHATSTSTSSTISSSSTHSSHDLHSKDKHPSTPNSNRK